VGQGNRLLLGATAASAVLTCGKSGGDRPEEKEAYRSTVGSKEVKVRCPLCCCRLIKT
jgi:hypothetical protein